MKNSLHIILLAFVFWGCSDDSNTNKDLGADSKAAADLKQDSPKTKDTTPGDSASLKDSPASDIQNPFGFKMTLPLKRKVSCVDPMRGTVTLDQLDMDWICTFNTAGDKGYVYIRNHAVSCKSVGMSVAPVFQAAGAFISDSGKVSNLKNALYDWGGNHHNDMMGFDYDGKYYNYYHSSFGSGWRKCQPMDCIQIYPSKGGKISNDGCTSARTIPAVCLKVDGVKKSYAAGDFVDTFKKCPGDKT